MACLSPTSALRRRQMANSPRFRSILMDKPVGKSAPPGRPLTRAEVEELVSKACPAENYRGKRVLLIIPDGTRTAPIGMIFQLLYRQIGSVTAAFDVIVALATHQPMSESAICDRLEISTADR